MTLEKPGRPKPWRVHAPNREEIYVETGCGLIVFTGPWDESIWNDLWNMGTKEDKVLALERASAINHRTEWFDHYGNRHVGWARC